MHAPSQILYYRAMDNYNLEIYEKFIRVITGRINEHFEEQKEYLCCKEGCALCCQSGQYPCTSLELEYLSLGFSYLPQEIQEKIYSNIDKIKKEKADFKGEKFLYTCPFLIDNKCGVYNHRLIVCRTFGLIYFNEDAEVSKINPLKVPFCFEKGLNYSKVYDKEKNNLSVKKCKEQGYKNEPIAYNLNFKQYREKVGKNMLNLDFGEEKSLIDWL